jgi:hypothetical protein
MTAASIILSALLLADPELKPITCSSESDTFSWCTWESDGSRVAEDCQDLHVFHRGEIQLVAPASRQLIARRCSGAGAEMGHWQFGIYDSAASVERFVGYTAHDLQPERLQVSPDGRWMLLSFSNPDPVSGHGFSELWKLPSMTKVELPAELELLDISATEAVGRWHGEVPGRKSKWTGGLLRARSETRVRIALPPSRPLKFTELDRTVWVCWQPCPDGLPTGSTEAEGKWRAR